jgi:hypothetical protein
LIDVDFSPLVTGPVAATLTITIDDPDEPSVALALSGAGVVLPNIQVPASLDFGGVVTFTTSTLQLQIDNLGTAPLNVSGLSSDDPAFVPQQTTAVIPPLSSAFLDVEFTPTNAGSIAATLTVTSDDPDEPTVGVALSGTGIEPDIAVPASLDFGGVVTFTTSTLQLQIDNPGTSTLNVSNILSDDAAFVPQQTTAAVAPGGLVLIDIDFSPLVTGPFAGTLTITSDDPDEGSVAVALSGTGIEPDIAVPGSLDYGAVEITTTATLQLQIDNLGTSTLNVSNIVSDDPAFMPQQTTAAVAPGGLVLIDIDFSPLVLIDIDFSPLVTGPFAGTLTITSDDPDESSVGVSVSGVGVVLPHIAVPASLDFGGVVTFTTSTLQLQIDNLGTATLNVSNIVSDDPAFVPQQTTAAVAPGGLVLIDIDFSPLVTGPFAGTLTITSDDADNPSVAVALSGTGIEPDIAVPASLDFGGVVTFTTSTLQLQIDNTGTSTLNVSDIVSDDAAFVPQQTTAVIAPGGLALIDIDFSPLVTITSDDPDEGSVAVALSGTGIEPDIAVPASLDFGAVVTFTTASLQLQIDNPGTSTLNVSDIVSDDAAFVPQQTTAVIAPGGLALIDIEFSPLVTGPFAGTLTITSDDPDEGSVAVALSGTGIERAWRTARSSRSRRRPCSSRSTIRARPRSTSPTSWRTMPTSCPSRRRRRWCRAGWC